MQVSGISWWEWRYSGIYCLEILADHFLMYISAEILSPVFLNLLLNFWIQMHGD